MIVPFLSLTIVKSISASWVPCGQQPTAVRHLVEFREGARLNERTGSCSGFLYKDRFFQEPGTTGKGIQPKRAESKTTHPPTVLSSSKVISGSHDRKPQVLMASWMSYTVEQAHELTRHDYRRHS
jgi:hypothetical protein